MSDTEAMVVRESQEVARTAPRFVIEQATEEADALASVIEGQTLYSMIQGRKFVKCEGWVTLACLRGCLPREVSVTEMPEGRYVAQVELIRMSDGMVLTRASAECGGPEDTLWQGRPPNARRSMAITRATGKACRVAFSWVMALAGFDPTPLEEMPEAGQEAPPKSENSAVRAAAAVADDPMVLFGLGKNKTVSQQNNFDLQWLIKTVGENINDPSKGRFKPGNVKLLEALLREKQKRASNAHADEPPHPADSELPF